MAEKQLFLAIARKTVKSVMHMRSRQAITLRSVDAPLYTLCGMCDWEQYGRSPTAFVQGLRDPELNAIGISRGCVHLPFCDRFPNKG